MLQLDYLIDHPECISSIAHWYFHQWGKAIGTPSVEAEIKILQKYLNKSSVPLMLVAMENDSPVGAIQLKYREMAIYPDYTHWIGGVFVVPAHRGRGIAVKMINKILKIAHSFNIQSLYLQTEKLDGGLYSKLGWKSIHQVKNYGKDVCVMKKVLVPPDNFKPATSDI